MRRSGRPSAVSGPLPFLMGSIPTAAPTMAAHCIDDGKVRSLDLVPGRLPRRPFPSPVENKGRPRKRAPGWKRRWWFSGSLQGRRRLGSWVVGFKLEAVWLRKGRHRIPQCSFFLSLFLCNLQALSPGASLGWLTLGESLSLRLPFPLLFNILHNRTHFFKGLFQVNEFMGVPSLQLSLVHCP